MDKRIIWIIDENKSQLKTSVNLFKAIMPNSVEIRGIFPYRKKEEYVSSILDDHNTACIIIDQKLKDTGIATYTGIELAQYLRGINKKLPIYILTNYVDEKDEFIGGEWSVEDIIDKDILDDDERLEIMQARILRGIDVYEDLLNERAKRFESLLRKTLTDGLTDTEQSEFENLQLERTVVTLVSELSQLAELEEIVSQHRKFLNDFKGSSIKEDEDGR